MPAKKSTDLEKLQGTWRVTDVETDGSEMSAVSFVDATITVRGADFTSEGMGFAYSGTIEILDGKKPNAFDLVFASGPPEGMRNRGIYVLDGDTWTICLATRGDARPRSFRTRPDTGYALETLERETAAPRHPERAKRPRDLRSRGQLQIPHVARDDSGAGPPTAIEGEFAMVAAVIDGKPLAPDMVKWCKRVTHGNVTMVLAGPQSMLDATFTLDPSHSPPHIDYVNRSGTNKGKAQAGIYEIEGNALRICVAPPGGARPKDFTSKKGDGRSCTEWRM
jgi:uncharacterized protein (TIGR03067 family)